jgi:hypothetical protein
VTDQLIHIAPGGKHSTGLDTANVLRGVGALVILVSLCLPMSTCTSGPAPIPAGEPTAGAAVAHSTETTVTYHYAFSRSDLTEPGWAVGRVVGFFWPLVFVILRVRRTRRHGVLTAAEAFLLPASAFLVYAVSVVGDRAIGAYVAWSGLAIYAGGWLADILQGLRALR